MSRLIKLLLSVYGPNFTKTIIYMLQSTEYQVGPYIRWFWRVKDFSKVMHRRSLVMTKPAKILLCVMIVGMLIQYAAAIGVGIVALSNNNLGIMLYGLALLLSTPVVWGHLIILPLLIGRFFITKPSHGLQIRHSKSSFANHSALKIAIAGSYGKTTMKEMLKTVLSEGKKVAATPANMNVAISHARFAKKLSGDEEILIIEFGEGAPGDVHKFAHVTKPNIGIITGLAPAHLDKYKTLKKAGEDIFSLADFVGADNVYVNQESAAAKPFIGKGYNTYDSQSVDEWKISDIKVTIHGTNFEMQKNKETLIIKSFLLGRHQVGPLAVVAAVAFKLGLTKGQIESGIAKIKPFEHRMEPRQINGAWILDDTYNGNIDGMKAGLKLLDELPAKRKIYITPGLVDQGSESSQIHYELGEAIAKVQPDITVLMKHSVTPDIQRGLEKAYKGKLIIEDDPLNFYNNLDQFIAAGDLVLMQNDWPDQYE